MALQTEIARTREELAADFAELSAVDWTRVWPGYSQANPRTWCAERGWQLVRLNRVEDITVRLSSGGLLYLLQDRQAVHPIPVTSASVGCWRAGAQSSEDNGALFTAADAAWSDYVAAASGMVGSPAVVTSFDDPAFPDRLAVWSFSGASALLYVSPSDDATTTDWAGGIQIPLRLRPADVAEPAGGA